MSPDDAAPNIRHQEDLLDAALAESFPASDVPAVCFFQTVFPLAGDESLQAYPPESPCPVPPA